MGQQVVPRHDVGVFLPQVKYIGFMRSQGSIPHAIRYDHASEVVLNRINHGGPNTAAGGATGDHQGVYLVKMKPICQLSIDKGGSALLTHHPFTGYWRQFRHDLAASSMLG
jgi:hypothetical protein